MARELVLVSNFAPDRQESMLRFERVLQEGFTQRGCHVQVWRPEPRLARLAGSYRYGGLPKYLGYVDKFVLFPRQARARLRRCSKDAVFHIVDHSNAVYESIFRTRPLVVTCHDLLQVRSALGEIPQNRLSSSGAKYQRWILEHLRQLKRVVCVSEKTRTDLQRLTGIKAQAAPIVYMGLNYPYSPLPRSVAKAQVDQLCLSAGVDAETRQAISAGNFLFGIGGAQWYKNRTGLVRIFAALQKLTGMPKILVYVGPELDQEQSTILSASDGKFVRLTGVPSSGLQALYSIATALVFPSWEEGFGWPIAEAQACGCPVFTSNRPPMTEVGGTAARYLDPADPEGAAQLIARELRQRQKMVEQSLQSAARWSTERMLSEYEAEYDLCIQEMRSPAAVSS